MKFLGNDSEFEYLEVRTRYSGISIDDQFLSKGYAVVVVSVVEYSEETYSYKKTSIGGMTMLEKCFTGQS